ncbi:hypothetical protein IKP85_06640 [bacterium]|nr:hypothetical protein [bacterium]
MTEETTISTPEETSETTETASTELNSTEELNTSELTPETEETTAETETETTSIPDSTEPKLYAGKYSSIEELEKGYGELNKAYTQANQIKAKYDEMLKQQQQQQALNLEKAQKAGFNSVEEQEIAKSVQLAEFSAFWNNMNTVQADYQPTVQQLLTEYYKTGDAAYLKEAKKFFNSDFLESVAVGKKQFERQLQEENEQKRTQAKNERDAQLADIIKADFAELLADVNENKGKAQALKAFCDADFIQSKEDMQVFADIYKQIADYERAAAIKEYEAQKVIDQTKSKAVINSDSTNGVNLEVKRTADDIGNMTQKEFDAYCKKHGTDWIYAEN